MSESFMARQHLWSISVHNAEQRSEHALEGPNVKQINNVKSKLKMILNKM